jgi:hypothetical protein
MVASIVTDGIRHHLRGAALDHIATSVRQALLAVYGRSADELQRVLIARRALQASQVEKLPVSAARRKAARPKSMAVEFTLARSTAPALEDQEEGSVTFEQKPQAAGAADANPQLIHQTKARPRQGVSRGYITIVIGCHDTVYPRDGDHQPVECVELNLLLLLCLLRLRQHPCVHRHLAQLHPPSRPSPPMLLRRMLQKNWSILLQPTWLTEKQCSGQLHKLRLQGHQPHHLPATSQSLPPLKTSAAALEGCSVVPRRSLS